MTTNYDIKAEAARLLELTALQARTKTLVDRSRARMTATILAMHEATGGIPKFPTKGVGEIRLDGVDPDPKARVADADAFGSWVAEHATDEVTATVTLPAKLLEATLEALDFAGIQHDGARLEVRSVFQTKLLESLEIVENPDRGEGDPRWVAVDVATGETVPGVVGVVGTNPTLKVTLDKTYKLTVEDEADRMDQEIAGDLGYENAPTPKDES